MRFGDVLVTRIEEASFRLPIEHFIPDAGADARARHAPSLSAEQLDADGTMTLVMGAFVVQRDDSPGCLSTRCST